MSISTARSIIYIIAIFVLTVPIHESVHWIQSTLDSRVEPEKIMFFGNIDKGLSNPYMGFMSVISNWTTNDEAQKIMYLSEWWIRELIAWSIQYLVIIGLIVRYEIYK